MTISVRHRLALGAALACLALAPAATAQTPGSTLNIQGNDEQSWIDDPHVRQFYETVVAAHAGGGAKVDLPALERKSEVIFRAMAKARGANPDAMADHLKLIPGQVVRIAKEDPATLATYDNFVAAVFGPR